MAPELVARCQPVGRGEQEPVSQAHLGNIVADNEGELVEIVYNGAKRPSKCTLCVFETYEHVPIKTLMEHMTSHLTSEKAEVPRITCGKCKRQFKNTYAVAAHYTSCTTNNTESVNNQNPLCNRCNRSSCTKNEKCTYCQREFCTRQGLGTHIAKAHSEKKDERAKRHKNKQWSRAERVLLARAEVEVRINKGIEPDERLFKWPGVPEAIYKELMKNQRFSRTLDAVKGQMKSEVQREMVMNEYGKRVLEQDRSLNITTSSSLNNTIYYDCNNDPKGTAACDKCEEVLREAISKGITKCKDRQSRTTLNELMTEGIKTLNTRTFILGQNSAKKNQKDAVENKNEGGKRGRNANKRTKAAKERDIFESKGPKCLLNHLRCPVDNNTRCGYETIRTFKTVFEGDDNGDDAPIEDPKETRHDPHIIHQPITDEDVKRELSKMSNHKAPGIDGLTTLDIRRASTSDIACLFNIFLLKGDVPNELKMNKTTFIPKKPQPGPGDWRPITIASMLDRLFAKILEGRLSKVLQLNPLQRAFMRGTDGCGENITCLTGILRSAKEKGRPLVMLSLDLAKAFDSVQHSTMKRALKRLGLDNRSIELLNNLSTGNVTELPYDKGTETAQLQRGIRQGWPLSPTLFLCVIDELLDKIEDEFGFLVTKPCRTASKGARFKGAAFADDLVFYSDDLVGMQETTNVAAEFFKDRNMKVNPEKSSLMYLRKVPRERSLALCTTETVLMNGQQIPTQGPEAFRMLGVLINANGKVDYKENEYLKDLDLVARSALRPRQKLAMISNCLIPMIKYRLVYGFANAGILMKIDKRTRATVRKIMHLPKFTNANLLHIPKRDGGLGLPCLERQAFIAQCKLLLRMRSSGNEMTRALTNNKLCSYMMQRLAKVLRSDCGFTMGYIKQVERTMHDKALNSYRSTNQGYGSELYSGAPRDFLECRDNNNWLDKSVINAELMRANLLRTREMMARTTSRHVEIKTECRACNNDKETQNHILAKCAKTQGLRVQRHNHIRDYLVQVLKRHQKKPESDIQSVLPEFSYKTNNNDITSQRRPDITIVCKDKVILLEVSIVYEGWKRDKSETTLEIIRKEKLEKYNKIKDVVKREHGKNSVKVRTMILGCRGGWLRTNKDCFKDIKGLKLDKMNANILVERAVIKSLEIYKTFNCQFYGALRVKA